MIKYLKDNHPSGTLSETHKFKFESGEELHIMIIRGLSTDINDCVIQKIIFYGINYTFSFRTIEDIMNKHFNIFEQIIFNLDIFKPFFNKSAIWYSIKLPPK